MASDIWCQQNKRKFDPRVRGQDLQPCVQVLANNLGDLGKHKLGDWWKSQPFVICKQLPGLPIYLICPEERTGPLKTCHHNHLLLLAEAVQKPDSKTAQTVSQRQYPEISVFATKCRWRGKYWGGRCLHGLVVATYTPTSTSPPPGETDTEIYTPGTITGESRRPSNFPDSKGQRDFPTTHRTRRRTGLRRAIWANKSKSKTSYCPSKRLTTH